MCGRANISSVHLTSLPTSGLIICDQPVALEIPVLISYQFVTDVIFEELMKRHFPVLTDNASVTFPCINIQVYHATAYYLWP